MGIEAQIIEFFWFFGTLILFVYAVLSQYKWKDGVHTQRRMNSYKSQNLPRNQFVIDDAEEQQNCKSEEDMQPHQIQQQQQTSIAQEIRPKINSYINNHILFASVSILNIVNGCDTIFLIVMVFIYYFLAALLLILKKEKFSFLHQICVGAMFINYLVQI